ncbi:MAG: FtsX-like permease family protein [Candidatus Hermodarchaeota archaeon]
MSKIKGVIHRIGLGFRLSHINLRLTLIALIGLTLGLSMVSGTFIHLDSIKADFYLSKLDEFKENIIDFTASGYLDKDDDSLETMFGLKNKIESKINERNLAGFLREAHFPFSIININLMLSSTNAVQYTYLPIIGIHNLNESMLSHCISGSKLPNNQSEILLFVNNNETTPISLNDQVNFSIEIFDYQSDTLYRYPVNLIVVGLLTPSTVISNDPTLNIIFNEIYPPSMSLIPINTMKNAFDLTKTIENEIETEYNVEQWFYTSFHFGYSYDTATINRNNAIDVAEQIMGISSSFTYFFPIPYNGFYIYSGQNTYTLISQFTWFRDLYFVAVIFSLPVLLIVALFVNFSLGIINEKRKRAFLVLRDSGVSSRFVFNLLLAETGLLAICTTVLALVLGIPISLFIGASTNLLIFQKPINPNNLVLTGSTLQLIVFWSFVLTFLFHFPSIRRLSSSSLVSLLEEADQVRKRKIKIKVDHVGIALLLFGIVGIALVFIIVDILLTSPQGTLLFALFGIYIVFLIIVSPALLFLGIIMTFNRLMHKIIKKLGDLFWRRDWRVLAIATRNLEVNANVTSRATLLVAVSLALILVFAILPISLNQQTNDNIYYTSGGELSYTFTDRADFDSVTMNLTTIPGLSFTTISEMRMFSYTIMTSQTLNFMGINENFAQVAHWRDYYDDEPLESLVNALFNAQENNSVIIDANTASREHINLGNDYIIDMDNVQATFSVQGVANYWPRLNSGPYIKFFVAQASYLESLMNNSCGAGGMYGSTQCSYTFLGKIDPESDREQVITSIKEIIDSRGLPTSELRIAEKIIENDYVTNTFFWFLVNINLVSTLVIILGAIFLFMITRVLRFNQEIALSRVLGMKFRQMFKIMFAEPILVFLLGGIPGTLAGGTLTWSVITVFVQKLALIQGSPMILSVNTVLIFGSYALIFLITMTAGLIASVMVTRANISKILKVE